MGRAGVSRRSGRSSFWTALSVAMIIATPPAVWWLVGDLSASGFRTQELDYVVEPPDWSPVVVRVVGIASVATWLVAATVLVRALACRQVDRGWVFVVGPLVVVAAVIGYYGRVITAGVIGANIGAGLGLILGVPFALLLVAWAATQSMRIDRRRRRGRAVPNPTSRS